jgi:tRNA-dihydrouridine synthase B
MSLPPKPLRIGPLLIDPPVVQAPMAGFTNYAYRQIVRRCGGAGLLTTEMVGARGCLEIGARSHSLPERLWQVRDEPRPLAVQIWDNDPQVLAAIGRRLVEELRVSVVDINFGCPVREVSQKAQSGSYLLCYPDRVGAIVARVVEACAPVPVTAKIRLGWTRETINAVEVARAVEAAGGAAVTVHGRTTAERFRGSADWQRIAEIKPHLRRIPLIGNGDLKTPGSVVEAFCRYGVDGVMIGRAALCRPWLFRQVQAALAGQPVPPDPTPTEQRQLLLDHYRLIVEQYGPEQGTVLMRRSACRYAQGLPGARAFRRRVGKVSRPEEFTAIVEHEFPRAET